MSVPDRVLDGDILYDNGRLEGCMVQFLIAIAGLSRIRFPQGTLYDYKDNDNHDPADSASPTRIKVKPYKITDGEAFKLFFMQEARAPMGLHVVCSGSPDRLGFGVQYQGKIEHFEDVVYAGLRCNLLHEGKMPSDIVIRRGDMSLAVKVEGETCFEFSEGTLNLFKHIAVNSPEYHALITAQPPTASKM